MISAIKKTLDKLSVWAYIVYKRYKQYKQMRFNKFFFKVIREERIMIMKGPRGIAKITVILMIMMLVLMIMFMV